MSAPKQCATVFGADLKTGDTIQVWWQPNYDTIVSLKTYKGPLEYLFPRGAKLASFALSNVGMTIDNGGLFNLVAPNV